MGKQELWFRQPINGSSKSLSKLQGQSIFFDCAKTPFGTFQVAATKRGVVGINFPGHFKSAPKVSVIPDEAKKHLRSGASFLKRFFYSAPNDGGCVRIDWCALGAFDRRVLKMLRNIAPGMTVSYGELARRAGVLNGARAVGNALHRNPIPILIPCHRVVRKDNSIGGFAGGVRLKQKLLELEKAKFS